MVQEAKKPIKGDETFMLLWHGAGAAAAWAAMGYYLRYVQELISRG